MEQFGFPFQKSLKSQLPEFARKLIDAAETAASKAYAPYSHFKVGAALLQSDGKILTGSNHENASYPAGICAERAVLGALDMDGVQVKAIAVTYLGEAGSRHPPLSPCGICRQSILEAQLHQQSPILVYMCSPTGEVILVEDASHLLPFFFSADFL